MLYYIFTCLSGTSSCNNNVRKLSFVHVTINTFSHVIITTACTGEAGKDVIQHLFTCFSYLGLPKALKTDNAPAYTSKSFQKFCIKFQIKHNTVIPYYPQGQALVARYDGENYT